MPKFKPGDLIIPIDRGTKFASSDFIVLDVIEERSCYNVRDILLKKRERGNSIELSMDYIDDIYKLDTKTYRNKALSKILK